MNSYQKSISTKEMSHKDWLISRRIGIGGSDVPAILGFTKYKTALDVYFEKTSETIIETPLNAKMKAGLMLENVVADWFSEETGLTVKKDNKIRIHKDVPFFIANIDRLITSKTEGPGILEIKTTSGYIAKNWEDGDVPLSYFAQLQHYLSVTGYKYGYFAVLVDGWNLKIFRQERDDEFIKMMNKKLFEFWKHVESGVPPEPTNINDLNHLYPKAENKSIEASPETYNSYLELLGIQKHIKELKESENQIKFVLQSLMKDADTLTYGDRKIITWKESKPRNKFETNLFAKDYPELYKVYSTETKGNRRFLLKTL